MLAAKDLALLRHESAELLRQVQQLEGFSARFDELPRLPPDRAHWSWAAVQRGAGGEDPGTFRWCWRPVDEAEADDPESLSMARELERIRRDEEGCEFARVPIADDVPDDPDELGRYQALIERFAAKFTFDAEWSARAVHDALRRRQPIRLPQPPHELVAAPLTANLQRGDALPSRAAATIGDALKRSTPHPEQERLRRRRHRLRNSIRSWLQSSPMLSSTRRAWLEAIRHLAEREQASDRNLREGGRTAMWQGALEAVAERLCEGQPSDRALRCYNRAKPYLNAAANGTWEARMPIEQTDASDYFTRIRPDQRRARRALRAFRRELAAQRAARRSQAAVDEAARDDAADERPEP